MCLCMLREEGSGREWWEEGGQWWAVGGDGGFRKGGRVGRRGAVAEVRLEGEVWRERLRCVYVG